MLASACDYHTPPAPRVVTYRTCDNASPQQELLRRFSVDLAGGKTCVFDDVLHRLPKSSQEMMQNYLALDDLAGFEEELRRRPDKHFPSVATSPCLVHEGLCPVSYTRAEQRELFNKFLPDTETLPEGIPSMFTVHPILA